MKAPLASAAADRFMAAISATLTAINSSPSAWASKKTQKTREKHVMMKSPSSRKSDWTLIGHQTPRATSLRHIITPTRCEHLPWAESIADPNINITITASTISPDSKGLCGHASASSEKLSCVCADAPIIAPNCASSDNCGKEKPPSLICLIIA